MPDRFGRREYGFLFFGKHFMLRHVAFATRREFERFHVERGPAHSYYSTAYYQRPGAPTMTEKGWMAAELIFDLDADHVPGAEKLSYPEQLARVKEHFVRLVDDFLVDDFGFRERDLLLTFSGGRGYHCHVMDSRALALTSPERREIVDYVTGTGLDLDRFLRPTTVASVGPGGFARTKKVLKVAPAASGGWGRRLNQALREYLARLQRMTSAERVEAFTRVPGVGEKGLREIEAQLDRLTDDQLAQGFVDRGPAFRRLIPAILETEVVPLAKGETDEPVTSDTKRLIRTPGSLHGKSGLRVVELTRDELTDFDPLRDAVALGDDAVPVRVTKPIKFGMKGQLMDLKEGPQRVPEWAAAFAFMRRSAEIGTRA